MLKLMKFFENAVVPVFFTRNLSGKISGTLNFYFMRICFIM